MMFTEIWGLDAPSFSVTVKNMRQDALDKITF